MTRIVATMLLLACTSGVNAQGQVTGVSAQDQVIGLLTLPEVFGNDPCEVFKPSEIKLYSTADSLTIAGSIRVDRNWTVHEAGGCEGLVVNVHLLSGDSATAFPTLEHGYETPAAVVLQQNGQWFKVRVDHGAAWLRASSRDEFMPLEKLLAEGLTYVTEASAGQLYAAPNSSGIRTDSQRAEPGSSVRVLEVRRANNTFWAHVEVLSPSACESTGDPRVVARGWMPAHNSAGEPTVWFYSRGC